MHKLADAVTLSSGWGRRFIALAAGACGALAMAPLNIAPALVPTMVVAVWLLDGSSESRAGRGFLLPELGSLRLAFGAGWWLGFGYFLGGLWWLGEAFLDEPEFAWALPLGVIGLPALLALFTGLGFVFARVLWSGGAARILALALGLSLSEWLRGHILTGFPWNPFGMALGNHLMPAQTAALFGSDGLTLITIAIFAAPATLSDGARRLILTPTLVALLGLAAVLGFGAYRLHEPYAPPTNVMVRIVQPGPIPNADFIPENKRKIVDGYIALSSADDAERGIKLSDVNLLVWPESAFPFILTRDPEELTRIGSFLPPKTILVTGAAREEREKGFSGQSKYSVYYNAIQVITSGGEIVSSYDKVHLVPFGEYLPFEGILRRLGLRNFVHVPGGFDPGVNRRALDLPGLPTAVPLICYEAIFPDEIRLSANDMKRARFLLNVTNDGWFGKTAGPSQHFAEARLRTIEQGLPMVRGSATGISAMIDAYGRVETALPLGASGIIDERLPSPARPPLFARSGVMMAAGLWLITFVLCILLRFAR